MTTSAVQVSAPDQISALALKALLTRHQVSLHDGGGNWTVAIGGDEMARDSEITEVLSAVERWLDVASVDAADVRIGGRVYVMRRDSSSADGSVAGSETGAAGRGARR